jgi:hypothetical protein
LLIFYSNNFLVQSKFWIRNTVEQIKLFKNGDYKYDVNITKIKPNEHSNKIENDKTVENQI